MNEPRISDELLSAYLDGEVTAEERRAVNAALDKSAEMRASLEDLCSLKAEFQRLPQHALDDNFAQRVLRIAEREMLLDDRARKSAVGRVPAELLAAPPGPLSSSVVLNDGNHWRRVAAAGLVLAASLVLMVVSTDSLPDRNNQSPQEIAKGVTHDESGEYAEPRNGSAPDRAALAGTDSAGTDSPGTEGLNFWAKSLVEKERYREPTQSLGMADNDEAQNGRSKTLSPFEGKRRQGKAKSAETPSSPGQSVQQVPAPAFEGASSSGFQRRAAPAAESKSEFGDKAGKGAPPTTEPDGNRGRDVKNSGARKDDTQNKLTKKDGDARRDHFNRLVERTTPGVLVVHVDVHEDAWRSGRFQELLERNRIAWRAGATDGDASSARGNENEKGTGKLQPKAPSSRPTEAVFVDAPGERIESILQELDRQSRQQGGPFLALAVNPSPGVDAQRRFARFGRDKGFANLKSLDPVSNSPGVEEKKIDELVNKLADLTREPAKENLALNDRDGTNKKTEDENGVKKGGESKASASLQAAVPPADSLAGAKQSAETRGRALRFSAESYRQLGQAGGFGGAPASKGAGGALGGAAARNPAGSGGDDRTVTENPTEESNPGGRAGPNTATAAAENVQVWFFFHVEPRR